MSEIVYVQFISLGDRTGQFGINAKIVPMVLRFDTSFLNYKPEFLETPVGTQNFVNTRA